MPENPRPTRIRVLSQRLPIVEKHDLTIPCPPHSGEKEDHGHPAYGLYNEEEQVIYLRAHLPFERARETLLHESLHALFSAGQLDTVLDGEAIGLDEHIVSTLAPLLLAFMRENPRMVAYLMDMQR